MAFSSPDRTRNAQRLQANSTEPQPSEANTQSGFPFSFNMCSICATLCRHKMEKTDELDVFSVRDLRLRSGELIRDAENGQISVITKHGRPAILALPFDERLLTHGVARALALHLFEADRLSLARAAKLAAMSVEEFVGLLGEAGVDAVTYPSEELESEITPSG